MLGSKKPFWKNELMYNNNNKMNNNYNTVMPWQQPPGLYQVHDFDRKYLYDYTSSSVM